MKARTIKTKNEYGVQVLKGIWPFRRWNTVEQGFSTLENAEKWISVNLFPLEFEVVAEYVDNTKKVHV